MKTIFDDEILQGMASLFWNSAWADYQDHLHEIGAEHVNLSGCEITEVSDDPDDVQAEEVRAHTERVAKELYELNKVSALDELYQRACRADRAGPRQRREEDADRFGSDLAFMSMGAGVSWFDDHNQFPLEVPYHEWHWMYLTWPPVEGENEEETE